jgi:hypothetical protein
MLSCCRSEAEAAAVEAPAEDAGEDVMQQADTESIDEVVKEENKQVASEDAGKRPRCSC